MTAGQSMIFLCSGRRFRYQNWRWCVSRRWWRWLYDFRKTQFSKGLDNSWPIESKKSFYNFKPLDSVPYEKDLILVDLLSPEDEENIDAYHKRCQATAGESFVQKLNVLKFFETIFLDYAREHGKSEVAEWIERRIRPLREVTAAASETSFSWLLAVFLLLKLTVE